MTANLVITGMTRNTVSFTVSYHAGLTFTDGKVTINLSGANPITINANQAASGGFSGQFKADLGDTAVAGERITLSLSDMKIGGTLCEVDTSVTVSNPYHGYAAWEAFLKNHPRVMGFTYTNDGGQWATNASVSDKTEIRTALTELGNEPLRSVAQVQAPGLAERLTKILEILEGQG